MPSRKLQSGQDHSRWVINAAQHSDYFVTEVRDNLHRREPPAYVRASTASILSTRAIWRLLEPNSHRSRGRTFGHPMPSELLHDFANHCHAGPIFNDLRLICGVPAALPTLACKSMRSEIPFSLDKRILHLLRRTTISEQARFQLEYSISLRPETCR